jgi:hypothetical protein
MQLPVPPTLKRCRLPPLATSGEQKKMPATGGKRFGNFFGVKKIKINKKTVIVSFPATLNLSLATFLPKSASKIDSNA